MKKFTTFETQLGESVVLTDKAKLSIYKKSQNSGYSIDILEEVYRRGYHCWTESFGGNPDAFAFDRVNSFIAGGFAAQLDEDLINEKRGLWDNIHAKRARIKAGSGERMRKPGSKGAPTDAAIKASQNEDADPCWTGYKQIGMKTKNGKKVPNCVPVKEEELNKPVMTPEQIANKHGVSVESINNALKRGIQVEKEHTTHSAEARKIALAHLGEKPDYYKRLDKANLEEINLKNVAKGAAIAAGALGGKLVDIGNVMTHRDDPALAAATIASYANPNSVLLNTLPSILKVSKAGEGENEFERQKKYQVKKEDAEAHSKDFTKPASRFIGSNELTDVYKKQTPGQIIRKVVKEALQEENDGFPRNWQKKPPGNSFEVHDDEGNLKGHYFHYTGSIKSRRPIKGGYSEKQHSSVEDAISHLKNTPLGQKPVLEAAATYVPPTYQPSQTQIQRAAPQQAQRTVQAGQSKINIRDIAPRAERSGTGTGRLSQSSSGQSSWNVKPEVRRSLPTRGSMGTSSGPMKPTNVSGGTSFSKGSFDVGKRMAGAKQTSDIVKGLTTAGREAAAKAGPAVARGLSGPVGAAIGAAAPELGKAMKQSHETGHKSFVQHSGGGEAASKVMSRMKEPSQGRSVSSYEKEVLTPKKYEAPKTTVSAPTPPSRPEYMSRGQAFQAARSEVGGSGGKFSYGGKEFQTNVAGEKYVPKPKSTSVSDETESGDKTKKIKEAIAEATYKGKKVPLNKPMKGDVKKSKVYVDPDGDGKAQKVNFGDKNMSIKKDQPARKKSYCARSGGQGNLNDKTSANYWSRRAWNCEETEVNELSVPAGTTGKREKVSTPMVAVRMASGKIEKHPPGKSGSSGGGDE